MIEVDRILGLDLIGTARGDVPHALFAARVTAAVLMFCFLTCGVQIPLGGFTFIIWMRKRGWLTPATREDPGKSAIGTTPAT